MKIDWTTVGPAILGGVVVGALAGGLLRGGPDMKKHHEQMAEAVAAKVAESTQPLTDRLAALEAAVAAQTPVDTAALIAEVQTIRADVDASLATQEEAQAMALAVIQEQLGAASAIPAPADAPAADAPAADAPTADAPAADAAPAAAPTEAAASVAGTGIGQTALFLDGQIRAFVSRVAKDSASIAVNGLDLANLAVGEATPVQVGDQSCAVRLDAVGTPLSAVLSATCATSPTEVTAAPADAAAPAPAQPGDIALTPAPAIGVGQTALFADGKLRAFVSRIEADGAVISIGTSDQVRIALGDTAQGPVGDTQCALSVLAIADDKVELSGGCAN